MNGELYRYKGCGLDNVFLANGYKLEKTAAGVDTVMIEDITGLHDAIAMTLVDSASALSGQAFRFLRKRLDMAQRQLAGFLGNDEQTVSLWERGKIAVPQYAEVFLRTLTKETISGSPELRRVVDRLNHLDREQRAEEARVEFCKLEADGWTRHQAA